MSITSDIRTYADTVLEQGKQVVGQAQHQINDVTGTARQNVSGLTTRASDTVSDLRAQAEKTLNLGTIKSAVEPYLSQAKQYRSTVTDRTGGLFVTVRSDKRVAKVVGSAEAISSTVIDTVNDRVVKPVSSITGRRSKQTAKKKPAVKASKPATTRPAAKKTATKNAPAKKANAAKTTAKTTAKATAKKTSPKTSTRTAAKKSTSTSSPAQS